MEETLVSRPYIEDESLFWDNEDGEDAIRYDERRNWTVSHGIQLSVDENGYISDISIHDAIYGDDGLGDFDPEDVFTKFEYFELAEDFMESVVLTEESALNKKLHMAILKEDIELVQRLIEKGANVRSTDGNGKSALYNACSTNNYEIVELLIDDVDVDDEDNHCSALNATDNEQIIDLLFTYGATRDISYYFKYRFVATIDNLFLFDEQLRDELINKVLIYYNAVLTDLSIDEDQNMDTNDEVISDLQTVGVISIKNGNLLYNNNMENYSIWSLIALFEKHGYEVHYEGSDNRLEGQIGYFYVE